MSKSNVDPRTFIRAAKAGYNLYNKGRVLYQTGKKLYNAYQSLRPTPVIAVPAKLSTFKSRGKRVAFKKRPAYRKKITTKARKTNRLVGKSIARPIYTKSKSTMRRYNKGKLSLQTRLQNGMSLPNTTFARLYWRGNNTANTACGNPNYTGSSPLTLSTKTLCLNDISSPPSADGNMNHPVTYASMWKQLYNTYLVLGAKMHVRIQPRTIHNNIVPDGEPPVTSQLRENLPLSSCRAGFWYVRCFYYRSSPTPLTVPVGHPIDDIATIPSANPTIDNKCELNWSSMREFLSDPTVTWKRDRSLVRQKLHINSTAPINPTTPTPITTGSSTSVEIEQDIRPIHLSVNFSAKKHFEDKNPLKNFPFLPWNQNLAIQRRFMVRIGYIAFANDGTAAYHIPLSRNAYYNAEYDIKYFVALREPKITPHDEPTGSGFRLAEIQAKLDELNQQPLDDDEEELLNDYILDPEEEESEIYEPEPDEDEPDTDYDKVVDAYYAPV